MNFPELFLDKLYIINTTDYKVLIDKSNLGVYIKNISNNIKQYIG